MHPAVGTEHLLLGLIKENEGIGAKALNSLGLNLNSVRKAVKDLVTPGSEAPAEIGLTPRVKKVLNWQMTKLRNGE